LRQNFPWWRAAFLRCLLLVGWGAVTALAHPLGNFTVSHFSRIETQTDEIRLHYVVDYAEIAAFPELRKIDANHDGEYAPAEKQAWLARQLPQWQAGLRLTVNGQPLAWRVARQTLMLLPGAVNLFTLRVEADLTAPLGSAISATPTRFELNDANQADRQGWQEMVLQPVPGVLLFDSTAFGNTLSNELRAYPEDRAPLAERSASWSAALTLPARAKPLCNRAGQPVPQPPLPWLKRFAFLVFLLGVALLGGVWQVLRRRAGGWQNLAGRPVPGSR
jgi:hypothetical protein